MWLLIFFITFTFVIKQIMERPPSFPPGPPIFPVVGNVLSVWFNLRRFKYHHCVWKNWSKRYGNLLGLKLGFLDVVIVFGKKYIKEVSSRDVFDGRPDGFFYTMRSFGKKLGIVFSDGTIWTKTRRSVLKCLKNFGYGSRSMENNISEESRALVELRKADSGTPIVVNHMFDVAIVNILWKLVAGKRYDLRDPHLITLCNLITQSFQVVDMSGGILNFLPFLRHIFPNLIGYTKLVEIHDNIYKFIKDTITEHRRTLDVNKPRDLIDAFLIEMSEDKEESFTDEELQVICRDLLEAGVETVSNTAVFMLLHLVRNQDIQKRLQAEIDTEIESSRFPALSDRSRMVYTEAVILETLRISSVAAVGIPHMARDDARLGDYVIPKGTFLLLAIHDLHNGTHWKNPHEFKPERFITKEGNLIQSEMLMPFGTGKRRCIGEGLARSELFMFLTYLLQKFNLKIPKGDPIPTTEPLDGVTLSAQEFRIIFEQRRVFSKMKL
ncbi:farnesoate epoxidase-like [Zerene cesonia]|uniref:farnesoate epoxidase-like n=1 Tax=Zerene cesonia TaxID=33412 RepID=UPI0018E4E939|nr:farnesoate epoxidase-like [Zerene cesonia]